MSPLIFIHFDLSKSLSGWPPPVLDPAGPYARDITILAWALLAMGVVVTFVVALAVGVAVFGDARAKSKYGGEKLIWIGGVAAPVIVLSSLLVWGLALTAHQTQPPTGDEQRIRISGEMWWWRVTYLDEEGNEKFHDANEIHVAVGQPTILELTSADVIHSFWAPQLGGKLDMIPGRVNLLRFIADEPGTYGGQCAEYCGGPHALMGFMVVAHEPDELREVLAARAAVGASPATPEAERGQQVFEDSGCGACHTVRGTSANGFAGPDLTHVAARLTLGAGILPNNRGTLAGWVANSQDIKPGNRMPPFQQLSGADLLAISAYLEGLK
jgi:cytochrome c oxidase subunit 2